MIILHTTCKVPQCLRVKGMENVIANVIVYVIMKIPMKIIWYVHAAIELIKPYIAENNYASITVSL